MTMNKREKEEMERLLTMFLCIYPAAVWCHHPNPLLISFLSGLVFAPLQGAFTAWKLR